MFSRRLGKISCNLNPPPRSQRFFERRRLWTTCCDWRERATPSFAYVILSFLARSAVSSLRSSQILPPNRRNVWQLLQHDRSRFERFSIEVVLTCRSPPSVRRPIASVARDVSRWTRGFETLPTSLVCIEWSDTDLSTRVYVVYRVYIRHVRPRAVCSERFLGADGT